MADDLLSYLQQARHAPLSAESLESMGKQAASLYFDQGVPLNEGVTKLAKAHQDINQEQIKRVCEFANTAVYLSLHDNHKTAGASTSYPQFDLADPARVIQDASSGSRPTVVPQVDVSYSQAPIRKEKTSAARADAIMEELFGRTKEAALAELDYSRESVVRDVLDMKNSLVSLKENLEVAQDQLKDFRKEAESSYYLQVRNHLLEGGDFSGVLVAARNSGASDEQVTAAMTPVIDRLLSEKIASPERLTAGVAGLDKVAHRVVNEKHPLVSQFGALVSFYMEGEKVASALDDTKEQLQVVQSFIRENFRASRSR